MKAIDRGVRSLAADLDSAAWHRRYVDLAEAGSFEAGFRVVVCAER